MQEVADTIFFTLVQPKGKHSFYCHTVNIFHLAKAPSELYYLLFSNDVQLEKELMHQQHHTQSVSLFSSLSSSLSSHWISNASIFTGFLSHYAELCVCVCLCAVPFKYTCQTKKDHSAQA